MAISLLTITLTLTLPTLLSHLLYNLYLHPLSSYPGPFLARLTNIHRFILFFRGNHHKTETALHKTYGPVVRVAPNWLSFSSLDAFEAIYGFNRSIEEDYFYLFGQRSGGNRPRSSFSTRSEAEHRVSRRRVLGPGGLIGVKVGRYEDVIRKHGGVLLGRLDTINEDGIPGSDNNVVNIAPLLYKFTLDTMLEIIWGHPISPIPYTDRAIAGDILSSLRTMIKMAWSCSLFPFRMDGEYQPSERDYTKTDL